MLPAASVLASGRFQGQLELLGIICVLQEGADCQVLVCGFRLGNSGCGDGCYVSVESGPRFLDAFGLDDLGVERSVDFCDDDDG